MLPRHIGNKENDGVITFSLLVLSRHVDSEEEDGVVSFLQLILPEIIQLT